MTGSTYLDMEGDLAKARDDVFNMGWELDRMGVVMRERKTGMGPGHLRRYAAILRRRADDLERVAEVLDDIS